MSPANALADRQPVLLAGHAAQVGGDGAGGLGTGSLALGLAVDEQFDNPFWPARESEVMPDAVMDGRAGDNGGLSELAAILTHEGG